MFLVDSGLARASNEAVGGVRAAQRPAVHRERHHHRPSEVGGAKS